MFNAFSWNNSDEKQKQKSHLIKSRIPDNIKLSQVNFKEKGKFKIKFTLSNKFKWKSF